MRFPAAKKKPRKTQTKSFPVPTAGLISNRNIAMPNGQGMPPGASVMTNWFPTPSTVLLRRGLRRWATLPGANTVRSLFTYVLGQEQRLFAASDDGIWDITTVPNPFEGGFIIGEQDDYIGDDSDRVFGEPGLGFGGYAGTNGDWVTVQFGTPGVTFVIGVNGVDTGFVYDGQQFWPYVEGGVSEISVTGSGTFIAGEVITGGTSGATATVVRPDTAALYIRGITGTFESGEALSGSEDGTGTLTSLPSVLIPGVTGLDSDRMSYVWAFKNRLFFIERDTLDVWYLPIDQLGGTAVRFPMNGIFARGGYLLFGSTWSLDSGAGGGLSEQCVFVTSEGEVAAYQGSNPSDANAWSKVGVYQVGKPLGKKAHLRAGGDVIIATSIGLIPLGQAIRRDYAALGLVALSNPIAEEWRSAVLQRGLEGWICEVWGEGSMVLVCPPAVADLETVVFVSNSDNGAWSIFTGWAPTAAAVYQGRIFIGATGGRVQEAWVGGSDEGAPYVGSLAPLFDDLQSPGSRKFAEFARVVKRSSYPATEKITAAFDFDTKLPPPPDSATVPVDSVWDLGIWDQSFWNASQDSLLTDKWRPVGGSGYAASLVVQVTSGSQVPLDVEIIRIDLSFATGDIIT